MNKKLGFNDVSLVSRQISTINSRDEIVLSEPLFPSLMVSNPIIASPMKDVCDGLVAKEMQDSGACGIIHRFSSIEQQIIDTLVVENPICAIGVIGDYLDRFKELYKVGVRYFCIDVANSSTNRVRYIVKQLLDIHSNCQFIVGNVMCKEGVDFWNDIPEVCAIRVGVAGGSGCTSKNATGMYHPYISLLMECREVTDKVLIADGGIKEAQHMCYALAAGADFVMLGSLIAKCKESPAEIVNRDGKQYKLYHGSASYENQSLYKDIPRYIEGKSVLLEYKQETIAQTMQSFLDGLKSSMSYANARTLEEYRKNVEIIHVQ